MKRLSLAFILGVMLPFASAFYAGGERIAIIGIKLSAIENGFSLARRDWQFDAVPVHAAEPTRVAQSAPAPTAKAKVRR